MKHVSGYVKHIIETETWKSRIVTSTGERAEFKSFKEFLSAELPNGLNTDFKTLWNLCSDHPDVQTLLDEVTQGKRGNPTGRNQHSDNNQEESGNMDIVQNSSLVPDGNTRAAGIRKLRKHAPELLDRGSALVATLLSRAL